jgi:DNA-binding transcriptional LysR family regulator
MHKYRWSDLEYVFCVATTGSVAAAARTLGVNHTTVLRRVHAFEASINLRIFERLRTGYRPTPEGGVFLDAARSIDSTVAELNRKIAGSETTLAGTVTITSTDTIVPRFTDALTKFQSQNPNVVVDVCVANVRLDLDQRESDIAVRASANPPTHLVGRHVCDIGFDIYATAEMADKFGSIPIEQRPWIGMDVPLSSSVVGEWIDNHIAPEKIGFRANSFNTLRDLAKTGIGQTILPRHVGDPCPELSNIPLSKPLPSAGLWVLSHEDVLRAPRVRMAMDFIFDGLKANQVAFEGT